MDTGHFNCRDYYLLPDAAYSTALSGGSFQSQASPYNQKLEKAKPFPLFELPLELRQKIYQYLLPCTTQRGQAGFTQAFARFISKTQQPPVQSSKSAEDLVWKRGQTSLLCVSRQVHDECAALLYGSSPFVLFVRYDTITFRYSFLLANGLAPSKPYEFLDLVPPRYLKLIKQLVVTIDHPDSYTGMIKYNVGGPGLTHGLREQVQKLVNAIKPSSEEHTGLNSLRVTLINGNKYMDAEKRNFVRARENEFRGDEQVQTVLDPFAELHHITNVEILGASTAGYADHLREIMKAEDSMRWNQPLWSLDADTDTSRSNIFDA
ncbi:hypothetical protein MBLNU457_1733t1 [Dothideomycetes sp. NU457]